MTLRLGPAAAEMSAWLSIYKCGCRRAPISFRNHKINTQSRNFSYNEAAEKRNRLFTLEKQQQTEAVGRVEKIEVRYLGTPNDATLVMNKNLSTPYDCARHLSNVHVERSALALIDGTTYWDMHRPLTQSCSLQLLHYMVPDPQQVNRAFWRTCSFVLGATISRAFKEKYEVKLHSFPTPDIRSGSFVYDAEICGLGDWVPNKEEVRVLSMEMVKFAHSALPIERLTVSKELALEMFEENHYKSEQIPDIARKNEGKITLYRVGDHVDISKGPMISNVSQIGRVSIPAVHIIKNPKDENVVLRRFQGVALPVGIIINHMAYGILEKRAAKLNPARTPFEPFRDYEENQISSQAIA